MKNNMKEYKVMWEVSKYAIVKAKNENEARDLVFNDAGVIQHEDEMTSGFEVVEIKKSNE